MSLALYVARMSPLIARWSPTPDSIDTSAGGAPPAAIACCSCTTHTSDVGSETDSTSTSNSSVKAGYIFRKFSSKKPPYVPTLIVAPAMFDVSIGVGLALPAGSVGASGAHAARIAGIPIAAPASSPPRFRSSRRLISLLPVAWLSTVRGGSTPLSTMRRLSDGWPQATRACERPRKSTTRAWTCGAT